MKNQNENVGATLQNAQNVPEEVKVPNFISPFTIKRSEQRTINLGNYENVKVDAGIEVQVEISSQEEYILAVDYLTNWLKQDLDNQEALVKTKLAEKEAAEKQVQIQQAETQAQQMKSVPIYVWHIQTNAGMLALSNDLNFEIRCPRCGKPMVKRKGSDNSEFYGCTGYYDPTPCKVSFNEEIFNKFYAKVNELIAAGVPNPAGLKATIIKVPDPKNSGKFIKDISFDDKACYEEEQPQGYQIPQQAQVHQVPQQVVQNQGGQFQPNTYYNQYSAQQYGAEEEMPF